MGGWRVESWVVVLVGGCLADGVKGQEEAETCYGAGSILGAVAGTLIVTVGLLASAFFLYRMYWRNRKGKQLVLMTDAENAQDQYAFDNPCFREATPMKHVEEEKRGLRVERSKWGGWTPVHAFGRQERSERPTSMDDSCVKDQRLRAVTLKSHDFTGLGFNICGNMRDGIFVKDVLHRGPAFESGCINTGDRIDSVCISFRNMVFEDALTILSYASPYDVQVQVENDSWSRPSTLMRSKRESNAVNCSERILHPKFTRSQSASQLKEVGSGSGSGKKVGQHGGPTPEKNRVSHSGSKWQELGEWPTGKVSSPGNRTKSQRTSPLVGSKESPRTEGRKREAEPLQGKSPEPQNKLHKFGIKVLPISINPRMGVQSVTGAKRAGSERSPGKEKQEKGEKGGRAKEPSRNASPVDEKLSAGDEVDASKENMKAMLAKGFLSLKEKMNQNSLGRRKKGGEEEEVEVEEGGGGGEEREGEGEREEGGSGGQGGRERGRGECPVPRRRSSVTCGVKAYEQSQQSQMSVPEEVFRAGDVARSNRKSVGEGRKSGGESEGEGVGVGAESVVEEAGSESSESSDRESTKEESRRPKRSKGKAPSPPKQGPTSKEVNEMSEIRSEAEVMKDESRIFEPEAKVTPPKESEEAEEQLHPNYDSDSDADPGATPKDGGPGNKIELNATQVTVHHSPGGDANDDDMEPGRKAASLGDLSRLDSDQPLSIVLERAVSLDLTEGTAQGAKKRKAPLPPSEEFPAVFDDLGYRKEPRLEGLSTFQRRLKKSSDFGTLEDALNDEPTPLDIQINKLAPRDLSAAHTHNIHQFSSWLAECRRPKAPLTDAPTLPQHNPTITSTSFVNINSTNSHHHDTTPHDNSPIQGPNVSLRVNATTSSDNNNLPPPPTSRTVVLISQPNSLEPPLPDNPPPSTPALTPTITPSPSPTPQHTPNGPSPTTLPTTPIPNTPNTLSSPLSSPLTYVTEIKVSTPSITPNSVAHRIHTFDSLKPLHSSFPKILPPDPSNLPIRTMKSETGQRVLATIQSLAKESSSSPSAKTPQVEYAKRMADLFSNLPPGDPPDTDLPQPNISGLYLKPSKDYSPSRSKVPPVVPPRKIEPSLPGRATVTVGLPAPTPGSPDRNIVTFSSFVGRPTTDDPKLPSKISFNLKGTQGELNGRQDAIVHPLNSSATKIVLDTRPGNDGL